MELDEEDYEMLGWGAAHERATETMNAGHGARVERLRIYMRQYMREYRKPLKSKNSPKQVKLIRTATYKKNLLERRRKNQEWIRQRTKPRSVMS